MRAVLFSTYELGRQPFGLASAAAWLEDAAADVEVHDLAVCSFEPSMVEGAGFVGVFVPMHTATRLAEPLIGRIRRLVPEAHICCFGLYAGMNADRLHDLGVDSVIAGEFEPALAETYRALVAGHRVPPTVVTTERVSFLQPDRAGLPDLSRYARMQLPDEPAAVTGYTEATRGCRHRCRHCPIPPVYQGRFVVVDPTVVLDDIRAQVGAGAQHITFGDPDFFNGPAHAMRVVRRLHEEFPGVTYDVTIKVQHLRDQLHLLPELRATGCRLVTTAVESFDDEVLERFDKGHSAEDFSIVLERMREIGLAVNPTFVAFTPWTSVDGYLGLLQRIAELELIDSVAPIQYGIRLLIPAGSLLLDLPDVQALVEEFDPAQLAHPWAHPDPAMDRLCDEVLGIVGSAGDRSRRDVFGDVWAAARRRAGDASRRAVEPPLPTAAPIVTVPYLTEPWYC